MTISSLECGFPIVPFGDSHSVVCTSEVKLWESFSSFLPVQQLPNELQQVPVLDCEVVEALIVDV